MTLYLVWKDGRQIWLLQNCVNSGSVEIFSLSSLGVEPPVQVAFVCSDKEESIVVNTWHKTFISFLLPANGLHPGFFCNVLTIYSCG